MAAVTAVPVAAQANFQGCRGGHSNAESWLTSRQLINLAGLRPRGRFPGSQRVHVSQKAGRLWPLSPAAVCKPMLPFERDGDAGHCRTCATSARDARVAAQTGVHKLIVHVSAAHPSAAGAVGGVWAALLRGNARSAQLLRSLESLAYVGPRTEALQSRRLCVGLDTLVNAMSVL